MQSNCLIAAVIVALVALGGMFLNRGSRHGAQQQPPPIETACPQPLAGATTIAELGTIPQDIGPYAVAFAQTMSAEEQKQAAQQFHQRYFSPWTSTAPLFNATRLTEGIHDLAGKTWYGENRQRIEPARMRELLDLVDLKHFPSMDRSGVVIKPTFVRVLPTYRPFYETPEDFPFDHLQFAELKPNEPIRILHASQDGAWLYIETSYANGWVEPDAVRFVDASLRERLVNAEQVVVVKDFLVMQSEGETLPQPKIGTLYPLVREETDYWLVEAAIAGDDRQAALSVVRIAKQDARRHPLAFTPENVTLIGNELLKTPYGWGELYRNRDCSATMRDYFLAFGIWLPRNSLKQINSGTLVPLENLSSADKETRIREQALPFRTLLHFRGHIMLYVGLREQQPIVLHTVWGLRYTPRNCPEQKIILGRTILSTLEAGKELPLSKGTLLDRLESMLPLPTQPGERNQPDRTTPPSVQNSVGK